jgi:hypothetical protein
VRNQASPKIPYLALSYCRGGRNEKGHSLTTWPFCTEAGQKCLPYVKMNKECFFHEYVLAQLESLFPSLPLIPSPNSFIQTTSQPPSPSQSPHRRQPKDYSHSPTPQLPHPHPQQHQRRPQRRQRHTRESWQLSGRAKDVQVRRWNLTNWPIRCCGCCYVYCERVCAASFRTTW